MNPTIALIGDYHETVIAHRAIPRALELARPAAAAKVTWSWMPTTTTCSMTRRSSTSGADGA